MENKAIKILMIDDNQDNLNILKALINETFPGAIVHSALNGQTGLEIADQEEPDIIFLDIIMSGMDGYEVCLKLKADIKLCEIPVVFISAIESNKEILINALECGAESFLTKPIDKSELTAQIRAMLKIRIANIQKINENERLEILVKEKTQELNQNLKDSNGNIIYLWGAAQDITEDKRVQLELTETKEYFETMFNTNPDAALVTRLNDGVIITVNDGFSTLSGYSRAEAVGKSVLDLNLYNIPAERHKIVNMIKENGYCTLEELAFQRSDKSVFTGLVSAKLIILKGIEYILTNVHDITNRNIANKALQESIEKYKSLFENSGVGIGYYTTDGVAISFNKKAIENLGGKHEDYAGKSIRVLFPKKLADMLLLRIKKAIKEDYPLEYEDLIDLKAGAKWFSSIFTKIMNSAGEILGVQIASLDITDRKKAEKALYESEERHRLLITQMTQGMAVHEIILDKSGKAVDYRFLDVNKSFEQMTNLKRENIIGRTVLEVLPETESYWIENYGHVALTAEPLVFESYAKEFGKYYSVSAYSPQPRQFATIITDITERKKTEENLIYLSTHDFLTDLYNRKYFDEELKKLDVKGNLPLSIIMADTNGLKIVNDSFGHDMGDMLLKKAALAIKQACRAEDIVVRYGGDEFVIILPNTNDVETIKIANAIKTLASQEEIASIELSISYGYATKYSMDESILDILANAENHMYSHKLTERTSMRSKQIEIIMSTLFEKSHREAQHSVRVSEISEAIASALKYEKQEVNQIRIAGLVHDIGKIGIDEIILNKPGKLDIDEKREIEKHPEASWRILSSSNEFAAFAKDILHHHEKWDGNGYPSKLAGENIPIVSRIIAVADAYDAMTRERSYKAAMSREEAVEELLRCSGSQFDPAIVDVFVNQVEPYSDFDGSTANKI